MHYRAPSLQHVFLTRDARFSSLFQVRPHSTLPTAPFCPLPTCPHAATPRPPVDDNGKIMDINKRLSLRNTLAIFQHQILLCTGRDDWASRIEDETVLNGIGKSMAWQLRDCLNNQVERITRPSVSILNTSLTSTRTMASPLEPSISGIILPAFKYIPHIMLQPRLLRGNQLAPLLDDRRIDARRTAELFVVSDVPLEPYRQDQLEIWEMDDLLILICGHGGRDARCGIYGPLLRDEFTKALSRAGVDVSPQSESIETRVNGSASEHKRKRRVKVALTSHIGGHQFAGNVGIWMPPGWKISDCATRNSLEGSGIWYGRVEPKHVEGIVEETMKKGRIVEELLRGVITPKDRNA